jgi:S1-C subfamily serine protease
MTIAQNMGFLQETNGGVGCLIESLKAGSQAAASGLADSDVITALFIFSAAPIPNCSDLFSNLVKYAGDEAHMVYNRGDQKNLESNPFIIPAP